ncbi:MAG: hypothetical protein LH491_10425, partial [Pseudoxanthomonas sp.]|nr:hypothetical protein [Pseudoxanthomonas sp.]
MLWLPLTDDKGKKAHMQFSCSPGIAVLAAFSNQAAAKAVIVNQAISEKEILLAQQGWCKARVDISCIHQKDGQPAAKSMAEQVIDAAYGYRMGAVLFKPTLTVNPQT